jgi:hypothetical protein
VLDFFDLIRVLFRLWSVWPELESDLSSLFVSAFRKDLRYLLKVTRYLPKGSYSREHGKLIYRVRMIGKEVSVSYGKGDRHPTDRELDIRTPVTQKFWLRLLPQSARSDLHEEIQTNNQELDDRFIIHSDQPDVVCEFLKTQFIQEELLRLAPLDRLEIYRGWLKILFFNPEESDLRISEVEAWINFIIRFADFYDLQNLAVKIFSHVQQKSVCPYCRAKIRPDVEKVRECSRCGACLHLECWIENGQCTTWGCTPT